MTREKEIFIASERYHLEKEVLIGDFIFSGAAGNGAVITITDIEFAMFIIFFFTGLPLSLSLFKISVSGTV